MMLILIILCVGINLIFAMINVFKGEFFIATLYLLVSTYCLGSINERLKEAEIKDSKNRIEVLEKMNNIK